MKTFNAHLKKKLKNPSFKKGYEEQRRLAELAVDIQMAREKLGYSQSVLAKKAHITQQQLSKIENGISCNITTFLKVCDVLDLKLRLTHS